MSNLATTIAPDVLKIIQIFGGPVTLRRIDEGSYDPSTGAMSGSSQEDIATTGAVTPYTDREIDGTRILQHDQKCYIPKIAAVPAPGDKVIRGSLTLSVVTVKVYEINGVAVAYAMQVRNA